MSQPIATDTLWAHCFAAVHRRAVEVGASELKFADVDALVVVMSRHVTEYGSWPHVDDFIDAMERDS